MQRVIAYIDGCNRIFRAKGWKRFYWLNIRAMAATMLKPDQSLVYTRYFTTVVEEPESKRRRQAIYLEALRTLPDFSIHYGHYLSDKVTCLSCGHTYVTHHEKMTDVNIAVEMMADAYQDRFDTALRLISADSDLVGPVQAVRPFSVKRTVVAFDPENPKSLMRVASAYTYIGRGCARTERFSRRSYQT